MIEGNREMRYGNTRGMHHIFGYYATKELHSKPFYDYWIPAFFLTVTIATCVSGNFQYPRLLNHDRASFTSSADVLLSICYVNDSAF